MNTTKNSGKTILILGGGVGGIVTANALRKLLPVNHKIILIEKNRIHSFAPSFLWLMTGQRSMDKISKDISSLLHKNIAIRNEEVLKIYPEEKYVMTDKEKINFDYLVVALGAELHRESLPGLTEDAHDYFTINGADKLWTALDTFSKGKIAIVIASLPYKCPAAPYEGAMLISHYFSRKGIRNDVEISLYTPEPLPMPVAGPQLGESVKQILESKKIKYFPLHKIYEVDGTKKELLFEGNGSYAYDMLIVIPPHKAPSVILHSSLAGENGWIPVDRSTLQTKFQNVYAIGDNTSLSIPGRWKPEVPMMLPKAGVFAHLQAEVVAKRISDEVKGIKPEKIFCGDGFCMLEAGEDVAGLAYGNFFGEPAPDVRLRKTGRTWHWGKILFEKWWLSPLGFKKFILHQMLNIGRRIMRIPVKI